MALLLIALAASIPFGAFAWIAAAAAERLGLSPAARGRLWLAAMVAAVAVSPAIVLVNRLPAPAPWPAVSAAISAVVASDAEDLAPTKDGLAWRSYAPEPDNLSWATPALPADPWSIGVALVVLGAALRLTGLAMRWRIVQGLAARSQPLTDGPLLNRVREAARQLGLAGPEVRLGAAPTPLLVRAARPTILLPEALVSTLPADQIALICSHELAHFKRRDDLAIAFTSTIAALFWFNPFIAAFERRLSAAREEVCDEIALADASREDRRAYAQTLVSTLKLCAAAPLSPAFTGLRRNQVKRRLLAILRPVETTPAMGLAATGLAIGLLAAAGGASLAFAQEPHSIAKIRETLVRAVTPTAITPAASEMAPAVPALAQRQAAKPPRIQFDIWVLSGAKAVFPNLVSAPEVDGFTVNINPPLRSTYEDGPSLSLKGIDIDRALAQFSRNELRVLHRQQVYAEPGGSGAFRIDGERRPGRPPDGIIQVELPPSAAQEPRVLVAMTQSQNAMFSPGAVFDATLTPRVRSNGRIRLSVKEHVLRPEYPLSRVVRDGVNAAGKPIGHFEPSGEVKPAFERSRTSTIELGDGEILALGGVATPPFDNGSIILIRVSMVRGKAG